jgi:hypothetical protein
MKMFWDRYYLTLGQISGYGAGAASIFDLAKDFVGLVGITAGATLSVWALIEKLKENSKNE